MMKKSRIAFATCAEVPDLSDNDRLAVAELGKIGIEASPAVWSEAREWSEYDAIILRSTWYYWLHYPEFLKWLDRLECGAAPVWNPISMLRWNTNKSYLKSIAAKGLPVVPTAWIEPNDWKTVAEFSGSTSWAEVIVKPVVSGGAYSTYRLRAEGLAGARGEFEDVWRFGPAMLQPFLKSVVEEGEYSFLFYGGEYSHAVLKSAVAGDFRVQHIYGGTSRAVQVEPAAVQVAADIVRSLDRVPLYARVDMARHDGGLQLMELELTEPNLFFSDQPGSAAVFADKVRAALKS